jgi:hypothetical protein
MCSGKAELTEINKAATNINTSKSIILQLETEIAKCDPNSSDQKPGNDSQSILSSSVGRRKLAIETTPSL